jgi:Flp pilus assembly protein TadD
LRIPILLVAALACFAQSGRKPDAGPLQDAERELFAARYKASALLYGALLAKGPTESAAYCGLIRALIEDHRSQEAYAAAEAALRQDPHSAGVQAGAGLSAFRRGDLAKAEDYFRSALRLDPGNAAALRGLASVNGAVSRLKTARGLAEAAYLKAPGDPELIVAHAGTLKGAEHIQALQEALSILDPESEQARYLRAHVANDLAIGNRKLRQMTSPDGTIRIRLFRILNGPSDWRGVGLAVKMNEKTVRLMLDTGASGISVSPKVAERAGLESLGDHASEVKGIGDEHAQAAFRYIASELRAGEVVFTDYPISVFRSAQSSDYEGLIGADVFRRFIVTVDFPRLELLLVPRAGADSSEETDEPVDSGPPAPGFHRVFRFGNHLAVPTLINDGPATLFLLDSGSSANFIDTTTGKQSSTLYSDDRTKVKGIQGGVKQVSRADNVRLVFAGFRQNNPSLVAINLEKMSDSIGVAFGGILGMPVLSQLRVTIDYREGTVHLDHRN